MKTLDLKIKLLHKDAVVPKYMSEQAIGMDLTAVSKKWDAENNVWSYGLGIAMEIPEGHAGLIFPRSSVYKTGLNLTNCVGVIDPDYRGEVSAKFADSRPGEQMSYKVGDRVCQLVIVEAPRVNVIVADQLSITMRGEGGYGSTGK